MEKIDFTSTNSGGFCLLDKKKTESSFDVSLMMMKQSNNSCRNYMTRSDLDRPFVGGGGGGGEEDHVGPINSGGANEALSNIYRDYVTLSSSSQKFVANSNSTHLQQPFHCIPNPSVYSNTPFKSPGMSMNNVGYPFTSAQWEELERQALIYKCMVSSVPVPPDLLFPLTRSFTAPPIASSLCNTRYSKNGDPEPGRCKRTDGKKWRCSRDVAPNQKYCERHLHRGRPRSRKPVEVLKNSGESHKKTRLEQTTTTTNTMANSTSVVSQQQQQFVVQTTATQTPLLLFNANTDLSMSGASATSYKGTNRDMSLIVENEMVAMDWAEQQWKQLMEAKMGMANVGTSSSSIYGSSAPNYHQDYGNFFAYSAFPSPEIEAPTGFIDAWSMDNLNKGNLELSLSQDHENLSPSLNLSMAMAAGHVLDEEMSKIQEVNDDTDCVDHKPNELRWLSPVSWEPFTLGGGPLAEALHPGSIAVSTPASPYDSMNSNQATTVSSPSGVLHRTLFSNSDGSVCNSPTFAAAPPSEIAFQWLN